MRKKIKKKGDRDKIKEGDRDKEGQRVEEKKKKKKKKRKKTEEKRMDDMNVGKRGNNIMNKEF